MAEQLHTFLFADISGYSRWTEVEGDEAAAELALRFASEVSEIAAEHGAEVVKQVGDAVMLRGEIAAEVVRIGLRLTGDSDRLPPVHAGIHTGVAIPREGDWWGTTVNVAARVAAAAAEGQLLITEATKSAARELGSARLKGLGVVHLKNITSPVRVYSASWPQLTPSLAAAQAGHGRRNAERDHQLALFESERLPIGSLAFGGGT
jgi:adenylate cyclase